jgi:hypothetical protein
MNMVSEDSGPGCQAVNDNEKGAEKQAQAEKAKGNA